MNKMNRSESQQPMGFIKKNPFNLSNDEYYNPKHATTSQVRKLFYVIMCNVYNSLTEKTLSEVAHSDRHGQNYELHEQSGSYD